eukprot:2898948-Amphidinium_carterae.1
MDSHPLLLLDPHGTTATAIPLPECFHRLQVLKTLRGIMHRLCPMQMQSLYCWPGKPSSSDDAKAGLQENCVNASPCGMPADIAFATASFSVGSSILLNASTSALE